MTTPLSVIRSAVHNAVTHGVDLEDEKLPVIMYVRPKVKPGQPKSAYPKTVVNDGSFRSFMAAKQSEPYPDGNDPDARDARAREDIPLLQLSDHKLQTAVFSLCESFIMKEPEDIEWGISVKLGKYFLPAVDLASGIGFEKACETKVLVSAALGTPGFDPQGTLFFTGNSYHLYYDTLMLISWFDHWLNRLALIPGVDQDWVRLASQPNRGVLRWSAGRYGRIIPQAELSR